MGIKLQIAKTFLEFDCGSIQFEGEPKSQLIQKVCPAEKDKKFDSSSIFLQHASGKGLARAKYEDAQYSARYEYVRSRAHYEYIQACHEMSEDIVRIAGSSDRIPDSEKCVGIKLQVGDVAYESSCQPVSPFGCQSEQSGEIKLQVDNTVLSCKAKNQMTRKISEAIQAERADRSKVIMLKHNPEKQMQNEYTKICYGMIENIAGSANNLPEGKYLEIKLKIAHTVLEFGCEFEKNQTTQKVSELIGKYDSNSININILKHHADEGSAQAQYEYAKIRYRMAERLIVLADKLHGFKEAKNYCKKSADQGLPEAQYSYAIMCYHSPPEDRSLESCDRDEVNKYFSLALSKGIWSNQTRGALGGLSFEKYGTRFTVGEHVEEYGFPISDLFA